MTLEALLEELPVLSTSGDLTIDVQAVMADSRTVTQGDVFVAVRGTVIDGHTKVANAIKAGAVAIVVEEEPEDVPEDVRVVVVENTRRAHAALLRASRPEIQEALDRIKFFGVTGTNGKTTVATVLFQALRSMGKRAGMIGTTGYYYAEKVLPATHTTPDVEQLYSLILAMWQAGVRMIVMEVSSHALEQERIAGINFDAALFTNLSRDHLDYHETMEAYALVKKKLFDGLNEKALAIVYGGDKASDLMIQSTAAKKVRVGTNKDFEVILSDMEVSHEGCLFSLNGSPFETSLIGEFNMANAALCVTLLLERGFEDTVVRNAVGHAHGPSGRMERYTLTSGAVVVIDYAHTPDALENVIRTCRPLVGPDSDLRVVFGCGGDRDAGKRPEMGRVASMLADDVWVTNDNPRSESPEEIVEQILSGVEGGSSAVHVELDRAEAIRAALQKANPGDMIIVAGKGHEQFQIVGTERRPFSDRAEVLVHVKKD